MLRLYEADGSNQNGDVRLYSVTSAWTDSTVSYNQSVNLNNGISLGIDGTAIDCFLDFDVTSIVQGWMNNPSSNYGLSLRSPRRAPSIPAAISAAITTPWTDTGRPS